MRDQPVGVGFIGAGKANWTHAAALKSLPNVKLIGVADILEEKAQELGKAFGMRSWRNYRDMLKEPNLEAVWVATPSALHLEPTLACFEAGKHVMLEKPMATSLADCDEMIRQAERRHLKFQIAHQKRYTPRLVHAKKLLSDGALGELVWCHAYFNGPSRWFSRSWSWKVEMMGGLVIENGVHYIDCLRWLVGGRVTRVYASLAKLFKKEGTIEDTGAIVMHFDKPVVVSFICGNNTPEEFPHEALYVGGTKGALETHVQRYQVHDVMGEEGVLKLCGNDVPYQRAWNYKWHSAGYGEQAAHFIRCIREDLMPDPSGKDGRATLEVAMACLLSAKTKKAVDLPLKEPIGVSDLLPLPWT